MTQSWERKCLKIWGLKMTKPILRQAMLISINDLNKVKHEIDESITDILVETGEKYDKEYWDNKKFVIGIINKQPKCSDTWEFE